jgi:lipopolysaccharide biosynthesis regulator YciM
MTREELTAHYELGNSFVQQRKLDKARAKYELVITEARLNQECRDLLYKAYKSKLDVVMEDGVECRNISTAMIETFGEDAEYGAQVYYDLALLHKFSGDVDRYINDLTQLKTKYPENSYGAEIHLELGLAYQTKQEVALAAQSYISYLNLVGRKHVNTGKAASNLASCYNALSKPDQAKLVLKRYMNIQ